MILENIKLIIWDLDDTFWNGSFSDNTVSIPENRLLILNKLKQSGIISTICSKNNYSEIKDFLIKKKLWNYFEYPQINYTSKVVNICNLLNLYNVTNRNVIFFDDKQSVLKEVKNSYPEMKVYDPSYIETLAKEITL